MSTAPKIIIQSNIAQFSAAFSEYVQFTHKTLQQSLFQKGRDLTIRLQRLYSEHKFGGPGAKKRGIARAELDARSASGRGIKLRPELMQQYLAERGALRAKQGNNLTARGIQQRVSLWQKFVGMELKRRQAGIGVLAASFLWRRFRDTSTGRKLVLNRTGSKLGEVVVRDDSIEIIGYTPGLELVDKRYSVVPVALGGAVNDMAIYFLQHHREQFHRIFDSIIKPA